MSLPDVDAMAGSDGREQPDKAEYWIASSTATARSSMGGSVTGGKEACLWNAGKTWWSALDGEIGWSVPEDAASVPTLDGNDSSG